MEMEIIEKKKMTREEYVKMRNNRGSINASLLYSYYKINCQRLNMQYVPFDAFFQILNLYPDAQSVINSTLEHYDTEFGIIEMSILKDGKREVIKYI